MTTTPTDERPAATTTQLSAEEQKLVDRMNHERAIREGMQKLARRLITSPLLVW
jgi:hypothetical protein